MPQPIYLKRRCFLLRFWRSYDGYRAILSRWGSIKAAFKVSRA